MTIPTRTRASDQQQESCLTNVRELSHQHRACVLPPLELHQVSDQQGVTKDRKVFHHRELAMQHRQMAGNCRELCHQRFTSVVGTEVVKPVFPFSDWSWALLPMVGKGETWTWRSYWTRSAPLFEVSKVGTAFDGIKTDSSQKKTYRQKQHRHRNHADRINSKLLGDGIKSERAKEKRKWEPVLVVASRQNNKDRIDVGI